MSYFGSTEWYQRVAQGLVPNYEILNIGGRNAVVGAIVEPIISETLAGVIWQPTSATTVRVKAGGNVNDTASGTGARTIILSGLDENYNSVTDTLTLAGVSASSNSTVTFTRIYSVIVGEVGTYGNNNAAEIIVEDSAGIANIITVDAHEGGQGRSLNCHYASPNNSLVWFIGFFYNVDSAKSNDVRLESLHDIDKVVAPFGQKTATPFSGIIRDLAYVPAAPVLINIPGNLGPLDVWVAGSVDAPSSIVTAQMQLLVFTKPA